ncbi:alpha/beta fold hydrolase [Chitinimonas naiadis]
MQTAYIPTHAHRSETVLLRGMHHGLRRWGRAGGTPVILLHGWMDCAATFQFMIDAAPEKLLEYELIGLDWRGFGQSDWAGQSYYFPDYLADLDALLDQVAPEKALTLLGHSMGGIVACLYAGIRPERINKVLSLEGFGLPATRPEQAPARYVRWLDEVRQPLPEKPMPHLTAVATRLQKVNPRLPTDHALWLAAELAHGEGGDTRYRADPRHKWVNPVLYRLEEAMACWRNASADVVWLAGDEARLLHWLGEDKPQFEARLSCFKRLRYETLPDCGHNLHHDAPGAVSQYLLDLLEQA